MSVRPYKDKTGVIDPHRFWIDYYPVGAKGKREQFTLIGTHGEAIAMETELRRAPAMHMATHPKVVDIIPDWLDFYQNNQAPETYRDAVKSLKHLRPFFGNQFINRLTPALIEQYKRLRLDQGVVKRTVNKELSYFSSMLNWAVDNGHAHQIPFKIKRFPRVTSPKPRPLTLNQVEKVVEHIEPQYRTLLLLMVDGGLRRSEALKLPRDAIEMEMGVIFVLGKGNKERLVPITTERLRLALEEALKNKNKTEYLVINPKKEKPYYSIRKALTRAAEKAGLEKRVYHHLLRHSFGTNALVSGMDLRAVQGIMGHSTPTVTQTYTHLAADYLKSQAQRLGQATQDCSEKAHDEEGRGEPQKSLPKTSGG